MQRRNRRDMKSLQVFQQSRLCGIEIGLGKVTNGNESVVDGVVAGLKCREADRVIMNGYRGNQQKKDKYARTQALDNRHCCNEVEVNTEVTI